MRGKPITLACVQCGSPFTIPAYLVKTNRRFCGRSCWFAWHRGPNNTQTKRVTVRCDHCGTLFEKTPARMTARNYCGSTCSRADHGRKIGGSNHPNWRGGALAGRGPTWRVTRSEVIDRQGGKCADCGLTEVDHKATYGVGLHTHHRRPYRLSLDNSPGNLVAVCIPCHGEEEAATHRSLTADDFAAMRANFERDRAAGFHRDDHTRVYDSCPECGNRKAKKSARCRKCADVHRRQKASRT
jgi:predicted RNA-binding Zn-ribbon protein involved in translation (DUF1610 family)